METVLRDIASKVGLVLECQRGLIDAAAWADQVFRERCVLFQIGDAKAFALISTIVLEAGLACSTCLLSVQPSDFEQRLEKKDRKSVV